MPTHRMYSVFDQKAEAYARPFCAPSRGMAVRSFADEVNREDSDFGKHAEDYFLFELGEFDERTGVLKPHEPLVSLGCAVTYRRGEATVALPLRREA